MSFQGYKKLFKLELLHDFYINGNCPDFSLVPNEETLALLNKYKLMIRNIDNGIVVFYDSDMSGAPKSAITEQTRFSFGLTLKNPVFTNFTTLGVKTSAFEKYYYSGSNSFTEQRFDVYPKLFNYEFTLNASQSNNGAAVVVKIKNGSNTISEINVDSYASTGSIYNYRVQVDLRPYDSGFYGIFLGGTTDTLLENVLADSTFNSSQYFGVVDVYKNNNTSADLSLQFMSKKTQWKYFIVLKNGNNNATQYNIVQSGTSPTLFTLAQSTADDNIVIATIQDQVPNAVVKIFKSPDPPSSNSTTNLIPFSELPKKGIALKKLLADVILNLPNPSPKNSKSEVFIYIDN